MKCKTHLVTTLLLACNLAGAARSLESVSFTNETNRSVILVYNGPEGNDGELELGPNDYYQLSVERWLSLVVYDQKTNKVLAQGKISEQSYGQSLRFEGGRFVIQNS